MQDAARAITYIDGFNLYYGALKNTPYKWLDLQAFAQSITPHRYTVECVRYFTARVSATPANPSIHIRQTAYLNALYAHCPKIDIHFGHFLRHKIMAEAVEPPGTFVRIWKTEEKGSDVNLAAHLIHDACCTGIAAAIIVSNDSDLAESIRLVRKRGVNVYWFPPLGLRRHPAKALRSATEGVQLIYPSTWEKCQLPSTVNGSRGPLHKPEGW